MGFPHKFVKMGHVLELPMKCRLHNLSLGKKVKYRLESVRAKHRSKTILEVFCFIFLSFRSKNMLPCLKQTNPLPLRRTNFRWRSYTLKRMSGKVAVRWSEGLVSCKNSPGR